MNQSTKGLLLIAFAGICWSTTGIIAQSLLNVGFASTEIAFLRLFLGASVFLLYFLIKNKSLLNIDRKGLLLTLMMGIVTQGLFNLSFFKSVSLIGVINATILLYLAPIFITFFSAFFYKEHIGTKKRIGVGLSILGSVLALTGGIFSFENLSIVGIAFGLYAALGYALVSVFSKSGLGTYHPNTLIFYSFLFGVLVISPFIDFSQILLKVETLPTLLNIMALGLVPASLAYLFYFKGIATGLDLSKVGVVSLVELIFAILLSVALLGEELTLVKILGLGLISFSIYLINRPERTQNIP